MAEELDAREIARENVADQMIGELLAAQETKKQLDGRVRGFLVRHDVDLKFDSVEISYVSGMVTVEIAIDSSGANQGLSLSLRDVKFPNGVQVTDGDDRIYITIPSALLTDETLEENPDDSCVQLGHRIAKLKMDLSSNMKMMGRFIADYLAACGVVEGFYGFDVSEDGTAVIVYINKVQLQNLMAGVKPADGIKTLRMESGGLCSVQITLSVIDKTLGQTSTKEGTGAGGSAIIFTDDTKMKAARVLAEDEPNERKPDGGDTSIWDSYGQSGSDFDN